MKMSEEDAIAIAGQLYGRKRYKQAENVCRQILQHRPKMAISIRFSGHADRAGAKPRKASPA